MYTLIYMYINISVIHPEKMKSSNKTLYMYVHDYTLEDSNHLTLYITSPSTVLHTGINMYMYTCIISITHYGYSEG